MKSIAVICVDLETETQDEMEELIQSLSDDTKYVLPNVLEANVWLDGVTHNPEYNWSYYQSFVE